MGCVKGVGKGCAMSSIQLAHVERVTLLSILDCKCVVCTKQRQQVLSNLVSGCWAACIEIGHFASRNVVKHAKFVFPFFFLLPSCMRYSTLDILWNWLIQI